MDPTSTSNPTITSTDQQHQEESVLRDILSELEKERIKRAEVEERLRCYEYQLGDDVDQADRQHKLQHAIDTFRLKTTESYHHVHRDLNPIVIRLFTEIYEGVARLNADPTSTTSTGSTNSKIAIPPEEESLIQDVAAHIIQTYRKTNMVKKEEIDAILKPIMEIAMEDFISALSDRWNEQLQQQQQHQHQHSKGKRDASKESSSSAVHSAFSFNSSFISGNSNNTKSTNTNARNGSTPKVKRRHPSFGTDTTYERQQKHYQNQIQTLHIQNQGLSSLLQTLTQTHPAISYATQQESTNVSTSSSESTTITPTTTTSASSPTPTLPLPIIQCLELMPWEERMIHYIQVDETVVQWQVWDGKKRIWSNNKWNFPTEFQTLPVKEVEAMEEEYSGSGYGYGYSSQDGGGFLSSTPSKGKGKNKSTPSKSGVGEGVRQLTRALESNIARETILLTDIHCSHILDLREGYPLPTQGSWEWIGGWTIQESNNVDGGEYDRSVYQAMEVDQEEEEDVDTSITGGVGTGKGGWSYTQQLPNQESNTTEASSSSSSKPKAYTLFRHRSWKRTRVLTSYPGISTRTQFILKQHAHTAKLTLSVEKLNHQVISMQNQLMEQDSKRIEELEKVKNELDKTKKTLYETKTELERKDSNVKKELESTKVQLKEAKAEIEKKEKEERKATTPAPSSARKAKLSSGMLGIKVDVVPSVVSAASTDSMTMSSPTKDKQTKMVMRKGLTGASSPVNTKGGTEDIKSSKQMIDISKSSTDDDSQREDGTTTKPLDPSPITPIVATSSPMLQKSTPTDLNPSSLFPQEQAASLEESDASGDQQSIDSSSKAKSNSSWKLNISIDRPTTAGSAIFDAVVGGVSGAVVGGVQTLSTKARDLPGLSRPTSSASSRSAASTLKKSNGA